MVKDSVVVEPSRRQLFIIIVSEEKKINCKFVIYSSQIGLGLLLLGQLVVGILLEVGSKASHIAIAFVLECLGLVVARHKVNRRIAGNGKLAAREIIGSR